MQVVAIFLPVSKRVIKRVWDSNIYEVCGTYIKISLRLWDIGMLVGYQYFDPSTTNVFPALFCCKLHETCLSAKNCLNDPQVYTEK